MKKYFVYIDDGYNVYKVAVPAHSKQDAKDFAMGNGEIIAVKDVTEEYKISCSKVADALIKANFGNIEIDFILRLLNSHNFLVD